MSLSISCYKDIQNACVNSKVESEGPNGKDSPSGLESKGSIFKRRLYKLEEDISALLGKCNDSKMYGQNILNLKVFN